MNKHSIKVPRLYKVAAHVAKEVSKGSGSIKNLVYENQKKHPNIKAVYALVATLYKKTDEIETLLKRSQLLSKETKFDPWLAKVLIVELLWGKGKLPGQSKPETTIRAYEQIFKAHLSDKTGTDIISKENLGKPRYVRVNTLLTSLNEAVDGFRDDGWTLYKFLDKTNYKEYVEKIVSLNTEEFLIDIHVPNLLVFPPKTPFYNHPAHKNGSILIQDKASCLPVHILSPPPGSIVLDMCAAPGMKTTHLAAVLNDQGTVYATERHPKRYETLCQIVETSGAKCIKTFNKDILECNKDTFPGVEYILVDPSCSGTGMVDRPIETDISGNRLSNLTGFQIKILRHALTKFPDVKRVVYSTCSILADENEDVVRQVLETNYNFTLVPASKFVGDTWMNFGSSEFGDIGRYCLYARPEEDYTNGFFVAVFERIKEGETNPFFNTRIFNYKKHVQANEKWKEKKQQKYDEIQNQLVDDTKSNTKKSTNRNEHLLEELTEKHEISDCKKNNDTMKYYKKETIYFENSSFSNNYQNQEQKLDEVFCSKKIKRNKSEKKLLKDSQMEKFDEETKYKVKQKDESIDSEKHEISDCKKNNNNMKYDKKETIYFENSSFSNNYQNQEQKLDEVFCSKKSKKNKPKKKLLKDSQMEKFAKETKYIVKQKDESIDFKSQEQKVSCNAKSKEEKQKKHNLTSELENVDSQEKIQHSSIEQLQKEVVKKEKKRKSKVLNEETDTIPLNDKTTVTGEFVQDVEIVIYKRKKRGKVLVDVNVNDEHEANYDSSEKKKEKKEAENIVELNNIPIIIKKKKKKIKIE